MKIRFALGLLLTVATASLVAAGTLISGPMLGYNSHREVQIWLETKDASKVTITYAPVQHPDQIKEVSRTRLRETPAGMQPLKFVLPLLDVGTTYSYRVTVDGEELSFPYPLNFTTQTLWEWRTDPPDFSFLFGSCLYINDPQYDRPGKPYGQRGDILKYMAASNANFMIWGGDNLYLREVDFSSESGIWYRYTHDRAIPDLQPLLAKMHHYATWDDHDYSSDNGNKSFEFKENTFAAFKAYWTNANWGEADNPGVYGKFTWGDAFFIMMDNRYYRDDANLDAQQNPEKSQYGKKQLEWLKQSLLEAKHLGHFTFKFIVTGSQMLQTVEKGKDVEAFQNFENERAEIMDFIRSQNITGVVFLTGDVHHSGLYRLKVSDTQSIFELTSSPLGSGSWDVEHSEKAHDPLVVPDTLVGTQNFCEISLRGPKEARVMTITCTDKTGQRRWSYDIDAAELK